MEKIAERMDKKLCNNDSENWILKSDELLLLGSLIKSKIQSYGPPPEI